MTRVLNAVAWKIHDAHEARVNGWQSPPSIGFKPPLSFSGSPESKHESPIGARAGRENQSDGGTSTTAPQESTVSYVQGMNVLAAPFLYVSKSEVQAFTGFHQLLSTCLPSYIRGGSMEGVHRGVALVDRVLAIVDHKLYAHFLSKTLEAKVYAFPSVLTLCACTPPLPEVLNLWDFLFAYGPHLNILCIVAQLVLIRDDLLASPRYAYIRKAKSEVTTNRFPSPNQILRQFPPLQAAKIKAMAISFVRMTPPDLYQEIIDHGK